MEIAVLGLGTRGDLYPLLGTARSLLRAGHRVTVLEYDEYERDIVEAGLDYVRAGSGSQCAEVFANVPSGPATRLSEWTTDRLYCEATLASARSFVTTMTGLATRPDALLAPAHHVGATLSAEALDVPLVSMFLGTSVLEAFAASTPSGLSSKAEERTLRLVDRLTMPRIAAIREQLGLPARETSFARIDEAGGLIFTASPLSGSPADMPGTFELVGYPGYYGPDSAEPDAELAEFLADSNCPVVVCTLGDGWSQALPDQLHRLAQRANDGAYRLVMVGGRIPGLQPGRGTHVVARANLQQLLSRADVSVNHGGMGTLVAALRNAVPSVMMTQWPDGRRNAAMLASQGLGIDLGSTPSAAEIFEAVDRTATDETFRTRLDAARSAMAADPDPATALLARLDRAAAAIR